MLAEYFHFSTNEIAIELEKLLNEGYISKEKTDKVKLTRQGIDLFVDGKPEIVKIEDKISKFIIDLIGFNLIIPRTKTARKASINLKLTHREAEKASLSNEKAKISFQSGFYQYIDDKEMDEDSIFKQKVRKIDSLTTLRNFSVDLSANLELKMEPTMELELHVPEINDLNNQSEILRSIRRQTKDMLNERKHDKKANISNFIGIYSKKNDDLLSTYLTKDNRFRFSQFVKEVFVEKKKTALDKETLPILGSILININFNQLIKKIRKVLENSRQHENKKEFNPIYWIRPGYNFWGRSQEATDNMNELKKLFDNENNQVILFTDKNNAGFNGATVKNRYRYYFSSIIGYVKSTAFQNIELIIMPNKLVCAIYYHNVKNIIYSIPIGIVSTNLEIIKKFEYFVRKNLDDKLNKILSGEPFWGKELKDAFKVFES